MRYHHDFQKIAKLTRHIEQGEITDLCEIVEVFLNSAYFSNLRFFFPYIDDDFCAECERQASWEEVLMIYLDNHLLNEPSLEPLLTRFKNHPNYKVDIFLAEQYYNTIDLEVFCDNSGYLDTMLLIENYVDHKDQLIIQYLDAYVRLTDSSDAEKQLHEIPVYTM